MKEMNRLQKIIMQLIKFYQKNISPMKGATCRYRPTCSDYSFQAIEKYGVIRGGLKSIWRILRCNPFGRGGYDPLK